MNVTNDAALDNYQLLSYGIFGSPEMIPGTEHLYENENDELQYEITLDWYDFVNDNRLYGLLCNVNDSGVVESLVEPYDMRTIKKDYTNVVAEDNGEENAGAMFVGNKHLYRDADYAVKQVNNMKMNALYRK